jgi:hypothetical protein
MSFRDSIGTSFPSLVCSHTQQTTLNIYNLSNLQYLGRSRLLRSSHLFRNVCFCDSLWHIPKKKKKKEWRTWESNPRPSQVTAAMRMRRYTTKPDPRFAYWTSIPFLYPFECIAAIDAVPRPSQPLFFLSRVSNEKAGGNYNSSR